MNSNIYQQMIYLVVQGTNCNDIIRVIHEENSSNDIELDQNPKLDELGVKEMFLVREADNNKKYLSDVQRRVLTTMDVPGIESAMVLYFDKSDDIDITPVPFISRNSSVRDQRSLDKMKELFGSENSKKYWEKREFPGNIGKNAEVLKTKVPPIIWKYSSEKIKYKQSNVLGAKNIEKKISLSSMSSYNFQKFLHDFLFPYLGETLSSSITTKTISLPNNTEATVLKPILLICNYETAKDMMNMTKKKYRKDDDKIERGSLWEFEIHIKPVMNKKTGIEFINYTKKFPTELNQRGLSFNKSSEFFSYKLRGKTYKMRDAGDKHPLSELITLECKFCKQEKIMKEALKKIYERQNPNKKVENVLQNANIQARKNMTNTNVKSISDAIRTLTA
jgi:hypothetical protein